MIDPVPSDISSPPSYWFMKWSLENSDIYDAIKWRLGSALLAQESISQYISRPLSSTHWREEVSQLFATSLARIQYDAWDIAMGIGREKSGYIEVTPDEARGQLCDLYKFKTSAYTNVYVHGVWEIPCLVLLVFFLTWSPQTIGLNYTRRDDNEENTEPIMIEVLLHYVKVGIVGLASWIYETVKNIFSTLSRISREAFRKLRGRATDN